MVEFNFNKPFWRYQNWGIPLTVFALPENTPVPPYTIDLKAISNKISHLLPRVQRQIVLDFGGDDGNPGD